MGMLHNKFGGQIVIAKLVSYFYQQVQTDNSIKHLFISPDKEQQRKHQVKVISLILGNPNASSSEALAKENPELNLQPVHYQTVAKHLSNALIYFGVHETHIGQIVGSIAPSSHSGPIKKWVNNSYAHLL